MIRAVVVLLCALAAGTATQPPAEPQPVLTGQTLDEKGQPVRRVELALLPLETNASGEALAPYGVTSDSAGKFEFYGVPPGRYRLAAQRAGFLKTSYGARNNWSTGTVLALKTGEPITGVTVRMTQQAVISGQVIADENARTVSVYLFQQRYQNGKRELVRVASVTTDPGGEFSFNKLAPGSYYLASEARGVEMPPSAGQRPEREIFTYYPGVTNAASAEVIELRRGQRISGLRLPLRRSPLFGVSGTITQLPPGFARRQFHLAPADQGPSFYAISTGDEFRFESVQPGSYLLGVFELTSSGAARMITQQRVEVSDHDIQALVVDLNPSAGLSGTIKSAGGMPAGAKLRIQVEPAFGDSRFFNQAEVNADGTFTIPGSFIGVYRFNIQGLLEGAYIKAATYGEKDALDGFELTRGDSDQKLEIVVGTNAARLNGVVRDREGKTVNGSVTLIPDPPQPQRPSLYQLAETDENGRFQLQGLPPGKYRLYAWEEFEPGSQYDPEVTTPFEARSTAIELAEGDRREVVVPRITVDEVEAAREAR